MERLQKVIAATGITSRRKAEELIVVGRVKVNDKIIDELGFKVTKKDKITVDDKPIIREELIYFLLNKPPKTICSTNDEKKRTTVVDLIDCKQRIFPVGRLDYDTTGVLILTNDGAFAQELTHPSFHIEKCYEAKINGILSKADIRALKNGVVLDENIKALPAIAKTIMQDNQKRTSKVELTIREGRNHQVKKMMEALGFNVIKLNRKSVGAITCDKLPLGSYRLLKPFEIKQLRALAKEGKKL